jgi:hypothetical protein
MTLINKKYGRLTVLARANHAGRKVYWRCRCACGVVKDVRGDALCADGGTRSWKSAIPWGTSKVEQQDVYDVARRTEVGNALRLVGRQLEPNVEPNQPIQ